ncbi:hypothetical protein P879_04278 [Paragonimus westermani]|uniref:Uncharacterized protein n=1 Tax=Paragonimus westermani TaxID=34504 RepID=A0A8T0DSM6_9TREM|nr:hypothetical protein P879_04278 [Paragonimus westermani]
MFKTKIHSLVSIFVTPILSFSVAERVSPGLEVGASVKLLITSICRSVRLYAINMTASVHRNDVQVSNTPFSQLQTELTGLTFEGLERIQVNLLMANRNKDYRKMKGPYYFPLTWYSRLISLLHPLFQEARADKETVNTFKAQILDMQTTVALAVRLACGFCGLLSLVFAVILAVMCIRTKKPCTEDNNSSTIIKLTVHSLASGEYNLPDVKAHQSSSSAKKDCDEMSNFIHQNRTHFLHAGKL